MNHNGILDFAELAVSSDLLLNSWDSIHNIPNPAITSPITSITFAVSRVPGENGVVTIAFDSSANASGFTHILGGDEGGNNSLVDSSYPIFPAFRFLSTNTSVSINKAAVDHFASMYNQLSRLKDQIDIQCPLIITGRSLGGSVASLFTLWLLDTIYAKSSKTPLCLTFGSPLLGNNAFQQSISDRPAWNSSFLHVISNQDPVPRFLTKGHMSFGTMLFLSESGCACFEEPQSILELIKETKIANLKDSQFVDYGSMLKTLKYNTIRQERIEGVNKRDIKDPIQSGITLQLLAIEAIKSENCETSPLITKIGKSLESFQRRKRHGFDETKRLNEVKVYMAYMEWYRKVAINQGGYYDYYKNARLKGSQQGKATEDLVRPQRILNKYWEQKVAEIDRMPKREGGFNIRPRMLYAGTNYKRMVEPLDIAEYYRQGKRDYINKGRPQHYKLLDEWEKGSKSKPAERNKVASLTEDSCFWARVEEALIVCSMLSKQKSDSNEEDKELWKQCLEFEDYVMGLIRKHSVSVDIFEEGSSFMKWWKDYKTIRGNSYKSEFKSFMNNEKLETELLVVDEYRKLS